MSASEAEPVPDAAVGSAPPTEEFVQSAAAARAASRRVAGDENVATRVFGRQVIADKGCCSGVVYARV